MAKLLSLKKVKFTRKMPVPCNPILMFAWVSAAD